MDQKLLAKEIRSAIKNGKIEMVENLISVNTDILNIMTPFGTWLHVTASEGQLEIAKLLIKLGADVNKKGGVFDACALKEAASGGHIDIVKLLLSSGAELDVSEPERNPLFGAIYGGHLEIAKLLVEHGIDIHVLYNGSSMRNMDAVAFAIELGQNEIADFLKDLTV